MSARLSARPGDGDPSGLRGRVVDGRYLVESAIGSGGFGVVYRARHLRFDSVVALKVLRLRGYQDDEERRLFIERFVAEGKMLFQLGSLHPAIVRVFEAGSVECAGGVLAPYLAMEWLDGAPLDVEIGRRRERGQPPLGVVEMIHLLDPAVEALAAAHRARIAHRDIKPANIFLCHHDGGVMSKLVDFGLAKAVGESVTTTSRFNETGDQAASFTPSYGAPEQWLRRLGATGTWTDVHALALVCGELLSGRRAFQGDSQQLMAACLDRAVRPTPRTLGADVSDAVERVFERALATQPRERFVHASELWQALKAAAGVDDTERVKLPVLVTRSEAARLDATASTVSRAHPERIGDVSHAAVAVPTRTPRTRRVLGATGLAVCLVAAPGLMGAVTDSDLARRATDASAPLQVPDSAPLPLPEREQLEPFPEPLAIESPRVPAATAAHTRPSVAASVESRRRLPTTNAARPRPAPKTDSGAKRAPRAEAAESQRAEAAESQHAEAAKSRRAEAAEPQRAEADLRPKVRLVDEPGSDRRSDILNRDELSRRR